MSPNLNLLAPNKLVLLQSSPHFHLQVKKPIGRKVSPAWDHFDKVDYPNGRRVAICKYCKRELSAASKAYETSSLLSHAAGCAKNPNTELRG